MYSKQFNEFKTILYYVIGNLNQLLKKLKLYDYYINYDINSKN